MSFLQSLAAAFKGEGGKVPLARTIASPWMFADTAGGRNAFDYQASVRRAYLDNPVAQRAVRLVAEGIGWAPLQPTEPRLAALINATSAGQSLLETLASLNQRGRLNCLLSDGERLFGYRDINGWKGLSLRKLRFREQGERSFEDASMEVSMSGDEDNHGCVIATRPLSDTGWHDLAPGNLVVLEGGTLRFSEVIGMSINQPAQP